MHADLAQWHPDPYVFEAPPESWRRAFAIAHLRKEGITDPEVAAARLGVTAAEIASDTRLIPYLDRTIAGLLSVLGWYVDSNV